MKRENNNNNNNINSSQLKVHKVVSHAINKRSYSSSSSRFVPSLVVAGPKDRHHHQHQHQHQRGPVIIYTHSPKVIHTNPRDFMALVQKLTGMSRPKDDNSDANTKKTMMKITGNDNNSSSTATTMDDNESSSVITDENCSSGNTGDVIGGHLNPCGVDNAPFFDPSIAGLPQGPLVPGISLYMNGNESDLGQLCNSGDSPQFYDYMNNFPYYNQIT